MKTILCYGDSNTWGAVPVPERPDVDPRWPSNERWTGVLAGLLGNRARIIEDGLRGRTTSLDDPDEPVCVNGLDQLPVSLRTYEPIDMIVLMLGTNDLKAKFKRSPSEIAAGLDGLMQTIRAALGTAVPVFLVSPPVVYEAGMFEEMFEGARQKSKCFADNIARVASRHDAHFIDASPSIDSSKIDGIHLDKDAHQALGHLIHHAISRYV